IQIACGLDAQSASTVHTLSDSTQVSVGGHWPLNKHPAPVVTLQCPAQRPIFVQDFVISAPCSCALAAKGSTSVPPRNVTKATALLVFKIRPILVIVQVLFSTVVPRWGGIPQRQADRPPEI